jgi:hypothetical protein
VTEKQDVDTLAQIIARGGGMNELFGSLHLYQYLWMGQHTTTPTTTGWGATEAGRLWYNNTSKRFQWWNGTDVVDIRRIFVSTSDPTAGDGVDGDLWVKYTP